jgi:hypothetical protein
MYGPITNPVIHRDSVRWQLEFPVIRPMICFFFGTVGPGIIIQKKLRRTVGVG